MKTVKIKINFAENDAREVGLVGRKTVKAFKEKGVKITKLRYTYVESKDGMADMPPALILAGFVNDMRDCKGFDHILPKLSGEYEFKFEE